MAHLLTISDIKLERERLINSMAILPLSYKFTDQEKEDLKVIYEDTLKIYDTAIARNIEVKEFELQPANENIGIYDIISKRVDFSILLIIGKPYTAKTHFAKIISEKFNNVQWIDGRCNINHFSRNWIFEKVSDKTDLIVIEDALHNNTIEHFVFRYFSDSKMTVLRKHKKPIIINTPKLIITANSDNCNLDHLSKSLKRRMLIINL